MDEELLPDLERTDLRRQRPHERLRLVEPLDVEGDDQSLPQAVAGPSSPPRAATPPGSRAWRRPARDLGHRHLRRPRPPPRLHLDAATRQRARPHRDPHGQADQVGVLELRRRAARRGRRGARRRPRRSSSSYSALGRLPQRGVADVDRHDVRRVRRERHRPDDAVGVVVLLDGRGHRARDADAVAAHHDRLLLAVGAQERRAHGLRVLRAEEEDVADLDAAVAREAAACRSAGTGRPARACRRSAKRDAGPKSRAWSTPIKCSSARWRRSPCRARRAARHRPGCARPRPTGPANPTGAPVIALHGVARRPGRPPRRRAPACSFVSLTS